MDDRTVGLVLRALRRRRRWRQVDVAARAGCSQSLVSLIETGHVGSTSVQQVRALFAAFDARCDLAPRRRGADMERLLDEAHATLVASLARRLEAAGWTVVIEVTYSEFGERGSIDVLALKAAVRAVLVVEVKTEIGSAEATARKLDEKHRLAPQIVRRVTGWTPAVVGRVLVLPESPRLRRLVRGTPVLGLLFPAGARELRAWLRRPQGAVSGLWFLSGMSTRNPRRVDVGAKRTRAGYQAGS